MTAQGCLRAICAALAVVVSNWHSLAAPPTPDHVVIVIEENHSYYQVIGSPDAPYMNSLAQSGASLTSFFALTNPSQPNYLQLFSGASQGVTDSNVPAGIPFTTPNLGGALLAAGRTFVGYSEDLPAVGSNVATSGDYARKHNPWVNWQADPPGANQLPSVVNQPFTSFPADYSTLPTVSIVVPNLQNDMHDGTIAQADAWLKTNIKPYADWAQTHNSLLIVTWDEDNHATRNQIATIFSGPMVRQGQVASTWTLHNLLRTVEDMYGVAHSGSAAQVRPIFGAFTTDPATATVSFRQGTGGYGGAHDTFIELANPNTPHGADALVTVDGSPLSQGLIRFDNLVGNGPGQVPPGATILSAKLSLYNGDGNAPSPHTMSIHRMLTAFDDSSTWSSLTGGVSTDGVEAAAVAEFSLVAEIPNAYGIFDVTASVQAWADGTATNYGWLIQPSVTDGWRPASSAALALDDRPVLEVTYAVPEPEGLTLLIVAAAALPMIIVFGFSFPRPAWRRQS